MLALIPARGRSQRLPGKNIRLFGGKPLIAWTILEALKAHTISDVVVSTDSPQIADIAKSYGARVPFLRPKFLATATASSIDAFLYTLDRIQREEEVAVENVCILQPTSPLRTAHDIDTSVRLYLRNNAESVVSFTPDRHPLFWSRRIDRDGKIKDIFAGGSDPLRGQKTYCPNGAIYVVGKKLLQKDRVYGKRSYAYVMPPERSIDIDTLEDFLYAQFLFQRRRR